MLNIAVVGPESTGKSTVAAHLAQVYGTVYVPEYSREYCQGIDRAYTLEDEMNIFYGQLRAEATVLENLEGGLVFMDTMFLTVKIWCDHLFAFTPDPVLRALMEVHYDYYLLMDIDLPWEDDHLRDFPMLRDHFKQVWIRELDAIGADYILISGQGDARLYNAEKAVRNYLRKRNYPTL